MAAAMAGAAMARLRGSWKDSPTKDPKTTERVANFVALFFFEHELHEYAQISIPMDVERRPIYERQGQGVLMLCLRRWLNDGLQVGRV